MMVKVRMKDKFRGADVPDRLVFGAETESASPRHI